MEGEKEEKNGNREWQTPLIKQYFSIVDKYPKDTIVLMRVGDFYETYGDIAITTSKTLGITLTKRSTGSTSESSNLELSGFPYHSIDIYLPRLIHFGYKVAICDQLEDPAQAKGLVKRGVTEYITPGLATQDSLLDKKNNNYLCSIFYDNDKRKYGIAFLDLSTGDFKTTEGNSDFIRKVLSSYNANEIIYLKKQEHNIDAVIPYKDKTKTGLDDWVFKKNLGVELLSSHFKVSHIRGLGLEDMPLSVICCGAILQYLKDTGHNNLNHIISISLIDQDKYIWMDKFTTRNLELVETQYSTGTSLLDILDETITSMGGRLLHKWILLPLKNVVDIMNRQNMVLTFFERKKECDLILKELNKISDIERLTGKFSFKKAVVKDLIALKTSLMSLANIKKIFDEMYNNNDYVFYLCEELVEKIGRTIVDDPTQSNFIKGGVDDELDELKNIKENVEIELKLLLTREIERTGITSLKISYNRVFGYYFEVGNRFKDKVPADWIRKQTLANCERFVNERLKIFEEKLTNADIKITEIENKIFNNLVEEVTSYAKYILHDAKIIAEFDCYINFAKIAKKYSYVCPFVSDNDIIDIKGGRHPVIERKLKIGEEFISNDVFLDNKKQQIMLITGPNMSGKSAYLRQVALITIMAQMGSFVPATSARIGVIDRIFTRVGASDNLSAGESTFMVEMTETASILRNISCRTLVLMDEIGRGTSTYDGISIAKAIIEFLHDNKNRPKVLFATHYHELVDLESSLKRLQNYSMNVQEYKDKILFLRKIENKSSAHSFGINVAKLAGVPEEIIIRANDILTNLEKSKKTNSMNSENRNFLHKYEKIKNLLDKINVEKIDSRDALTILFELKNIIK